MTSLRRKMSEPETDSSSPKKPKNCSVSNQTFNSYTKTCNVYKTARLIIPTEYSLVLENGSENGSGSEIKIESSDVQRISPSQLEKISSKNNCQTFMPISSTEERNLFITSKHDENNTEPNYNDIQNFNNNLDLPLKNNSNTLAMDNMANAILDIAKLLAPGIKSKYNKIMSNKGNDTLEIRMLFNNKTAGRIIGNAGTNIRKMKNKFNNNINIYRENPPKSTDRVCQIYGSPESCLATVKELLKIQRTTDIEMVKTEDRRNFYNAENHIAYKQDYGGYKTVASMKASREFDQSQFETRSNSSGTASASPSETEGSGIGKSDSGLGSGQSYQGNMNYFHSNSQYSYIRGPSPINLNFNNSCKLRFLIPAKRAGAIIGKGGEVIKKLQEENNCYINAKHEDSADRVLIIHSHKVYATPTTNAAATTNKNQLTSNSENAFNVFKIILNILADSLREEAKLNDFEMKKPNPSLGEQESDITEIRMLVNNNLVGIVVGTKGKIINKIRNETNCFIHIFDECCPNNSTDKAIKISGTQENIILAVKEIYAIVVRNQDKKGQERYYNGGLDPNFILSKDSYGGDIKSYSNKPVEITRNGYSHHQNNHYGSGSGSVAYQPPSVHQNMNQNLMNVNVHHQNYQNTLNPNFQRQPLGPPSQENFILQNFSNRPTAVYGSAMPNTTNCIPPRMAIANAATTKQKEIVLTNRTSHREIDAKTYEYVKQQVMEDMFKEYLAKRVAQ